MVAPVEEGEIRVGVAHTDDQRIEFEVHGVQKLGAEQLPAVGEQPLEPRRGEQAFRPPVHGEPEDHGVDRDVRELLRHERPDPEAPAGHRDAERGGEERAAERGEEEALELQGLGHVGLLHVLHTRDHERQPQHAQDGREGRRAVHPGDQRREKEEQGVEQHAEAQVEPEHRGEIQIVRVLFLDQGVGHPAVHKDQQDGGKDRHLGDGAVLRGVEDAGEHHRDREGHELRAAAFKKAPYQVGDDFGFVILCASDTTGADGAGRASGRC